MIGPGGEIGYMWGDEIVPLRDGVEIGGGFRARKPGKTDEPGAWLREGVRFRYRAQGGALVLSWDAQAGDRFGVMTWANGGRYTATPGGIRVGAGQHTFSVAPPSWSVGSIQAGCCSLDVRGVAGTITAPAPGPLTWRIGPAGP
jgi:hypothetical protein